jgi:Zn-dependent alcohol dehydrogenase
MQVAGIRRVGTPVEMIEVGEPRPLADDEVLVEMRAAGVGNWDEFVRTGGWDVGTTPPIGCPATRSWRIRCRCETRAPGRPG